MSHRPKRRTIAARPPFSTRWRAIGRRPFGRLRPAAGGHRGHQAHNR
jgi:hypothetical protein